MLSRRIFAWVLEYFCWVYCWGVDNNVQKKKGFSSWFSSTLNRSEYKYLFISWAILLTKQPYIYLILFYKQWIILCVFLNGFLWYIYMMDEIFWFYLFIYLFIYFWMRSQSLRSVLCSLRGVQRGRGKRAKRSAAMRRPHTLSLLSCHPSSLWL